MLKIFPLEENLILPKKGHEGDAGWDLYSRQNKVLKPRERHQFKLGFAVIGEKDYEYRIEGKSSLALNFGITTIGNIIDNKYRGEISCILINLSKDKFKILKGQKIAQLVVSNISDDDKLMIQEYIDTTSRGNEGFGSTGRT